ncbi:Anaphase-promoting complex subunit 2 [Thelohanellus kitauei]|uniref:Anaphase-promoting complex subunit 2 n=1 Tax=Thelohanellus kitauei TaxID=669202 RepID=A0A0C2MJ55_THEKT|nr:Anaphase-promoting complex subunit 2 [Thelohanellus kitauei]
MNLLVKKIMNERETMTLDQKCKKEENRVEAELDQEDLLYFREKHEPPSNLIFSIVQVYGTSAQFIDEYSKQLADRIFKIQTEDDLIYEVNKIRMLGKHFGLDSINQCSIMVNDIKESKRLNKDVIKRCGELWDCRYDFEALIVTPYIWDIAEEFTENQFTVPSNIER